MVWGRDVNPGPSHLEACMGNGVGGQESRDTAKNSRTERSPGSARASAAQHPHQGGAGKSWGTEAPGGSPRSQSLEQSQEPWPPRLWVRHRG